MNGAQSKFIITADEGVRGGKPIPLKKTVDQALEKSLQVQKVLVVKHRSADIFIKPGRDIWYHEEIKNVGNDCPPEKMNSEDPLIYAVYVGFYE